MVAASGDGAIELLGRESFDAVLSDVRLPGTHDGVALARWIRSSHPGLAVVLMTGYTSELAAAQALGVPVLAKPAPAGALLRALDWALRASAEARGGPAPERRSFPRRSADSGVVDAGQHAAGLAVAPDCVGARLHKAECVTDTFSGLKTP